LRSIRRHPSSFSFSFSFSFAFVARSCAVAALGASACLLASSVARADDAAAPRPTAPADGADARTTEWAARERALDEGSALGGGTGLLRLRHAEIGAPGQLRISFGNEWFSAGFLCTSGQPCANPRGGAALTSDTMSHTGAVLSLDVALAKLGRGGLGLHASYAASSSSDSANSPSVLQAVGDTSLGITYATPLSDVFRVGASAELWIVDGSGTVGPNAGATSAKLVLLGTADLRETSSHVPLRFGVNVGYSLDNTGNTADDAEAGRGIPITRVERFALGINRVDHLDLRVGAEALLVEDRVRPFVEYGVFVPVNRQNYVCRKPNGSNDSCIVSTPTVPSTLTLGARVFPWHHGFSLLAAVDIGVTGTSNFVQELAPTAPWMLHIGAGWAFDTQAAPERVRVETVERRVEVVKAPVLGHLHGLVHDKQTPVARAIVAYAAPSTLSPLATDDAGHFADDVVPGDYHFTVSADGYKPGACDAKVSAEGGDVTVDCSLEALPKVGSIALVVRDADVGTPIGGAVVHVVDAAHKDWVATADAGGTVKLEGLAPGDAAVTAMTDDHLLATRDTTIEARGVARVELMMHRKPKASAVDIGKTTIKLKAAIQFDPDSATLRSDASAVLTELADALARHAEIELVEIQAHVDDAGAAGAMADLSQRRADAVRDWLVRHGITGDRLVARGLGSTKPLAPNVTTANRARNRRIELVITKRAEPARP
jgi:outer membrane protein OmpA-like peptidoglycan-associated protein